MLNRPTLDYLSRATIEIKIYIQEKERGIMMINYLKKYFNRTHYIVFDLEFNQGYRFQNKAYAKTLYDKFNKRPMEIIEIGAVLLNHKFQVKKTFHKFIKPQIYKDLRPCVSRLTKIDKRILEAEGIPFNEAFIAFEKWATQLSNVILCTWDDIDIQVIKSNMKYHRVNSELFNYYPTLDIQRVFNKDKRVGLKKALEELNIPADKQFHRAVDDAYMTAQVFRELNSIVTIAA